MTNKKLQITLSFVLIIAVSLFMLTSFTSKKRLSFSFSLPACSSLDSSFLPNSKAGWSIFRETVYLHKDADSTDFEAVLSREVPLDNKWSYPSEAGTLLSAFRPDTGRTVLYKEPNRIWSITIEPDGKCFIQLLDGAEPMGRSVVLPIKIRFKN